MIDIHSHILPGIDDGSDSLDMTLEMLAMAEESGVRDIAATSHCNIPGVYDNYVSRDLQLLCRKVLEAKRNAGLSIRLHRGMEIFATEELPELLRSGRVWTLGGTRYFLTEFSFEEDPDFCEQILRRCRRLGYRPVVAHPERYYFVQRNPQIAYDWCTSGCVLQVNKGSLLGRFGRNEQETGVSLVQHGLAACVASDAHGVDHRTTYMREAEQFLISEFGAEYARILTAENPYRILDGQELLGYEPIPFV